MTLKQKENMGFYEIVILWIRIWDCELLRSTEHARICLLSTHALSKKRRGGGGGRGGKGGGIKEIKTWSRVVCLAALFARKCPFDNVAPHDDSRKAGFQGHSNLNYFDKAFRSISHKRWGGHSRTLARPLDSVSHRLWAGQSYLNYFDKAFRFTLPQTLRLY